jgi:creatinine amidohydrolase
MREVLWERMKRTDIEQAAKAGAVAIIPIASLEQHANHLPVNTDSNIVSTIAERAARAIEGVPVLILPTIWTGYSPHHMTYSGSVTLKYHTFVDVLTQVAASVHAHGFRKILLLNGHGGNSAVVAGMRTKLLEEDGVSIVGYDYWNLPPMPEAMRRLCMTDKGFVGHAGEFETSVQMYLQSELVETGAAVWAPGAFGDPSAATAEKGRGLIEVAVEALVRLLRAYHNGEVEEQLRWRKEAPE